MTARKRNPRPREDTKAPAPAAAPGLAARQAAARLLAAVIDTRTSLDGLTDAENGHPQFRALDGRDRALVRAILVTALRFRGTIAALLEARLERPLPPNAHALSHILNVAAAQILFLDVPDSAAVDLAVTQAHADPRARRFAKLVNALLRRLAREKDAALPAALDSVPDAPDWLVERLRAAYGGEKASAILAAHRVEPATDFTVKTDFDGWAERLGGTVLPTGSVRVGALAASVADLPGFAEGRWWVQDAAASLPARLMGNVAGLHVADLCAAPGGKTAQLVLAGAHVTAIDISKNRLKRLEANLARLGLAAECVAADILDYAPREPFDAVLLDAPCSSTGTIRRHPDVAWTKTPEDVDKLAGLQKRMLERALTLVKPGGLVVFSNCSLDPREGEEVVAAVVAENPSVHPVPIAAEAHPALAGFVTERGMLRTTPADLPTDTARMGGLDGFFAACLRSTPG